MATSDPLDDLVRAAQRGDTMALHDLLDHLEPYVARICGPIALSDAADATQEALIAIFRGLPALREPAALYGWVRAVTTREAVRVARRRTRLGTDELTDLPAPGDPTLAIDVRDALERMTPEHRAVLVLRDLDDLDEAAVATLLAIPEGTVKSRLHRARRRFREAWSR